MSMLQLLKLLQTYGTKLPLIWPHLLHIAEDCKKILAILNDGAEVDVAGVFTTTPETAACLQACADAGIPADEAQTVVETIAAYNNAV